MHTLLNLLPGKGQAKAIGSLLCLLLLTANAFATDYYVATTGNDAANNGRSVDSPYATIQKAADVAGPGDVVYVLEGTYREQVAIKSNGVTFRPYGSDVVTINGTDLMLDWTPIAGSTYQTTMNWDMSIWGSNQVFQDGEMIELARWPKQTSPDIVMPTNAKIDTAYYVGNNTVFVDNDFNEPAERWIGAQIWFNNSRHGHDGQGRTSTIVAINGHAITVKERAHNLSNRPWGVGKDTEYFLFNPTPAGVAASGGVDALLAPGEWWKDGTNLYVKTRTGAAPSSTGTGSNVIEAKKRHFAFIPGTVNRSGYTIQDFHLFACSVTTDKDAVSIVNGNTVANNRIVEEAHDITLAGLKVKYVSHQTIMAGDYQSEHYVWTGIVVSGRNNTIRDCDIQYAATSAVSLQGVGIKMLNNHIHETNYMSSNSGAVNTGFICRDAEIGYNRIWNTTMMGINIRALKSSNPEVKHTARVHHNTIYDFMMRSYDSSAIDVVGEDLQWVRIDHNLIYNTRPEAIIGHRKYGIYLDFGGGTDRRTRATVDHNVVYQVNNPMTVNPGWDVHIFNNVLLGLKDSAPFAAEPGKALSLQMNTAEGPNVGRNVRVYNNILSGEPYLAYTNPYVSVLNNITNAQEGDVLNELFVDATNPNLAARDYRLKPTAARAIDQGISVDEYTDNYTDNEPIAGLTDIGAFEFPASSVSGDTEAPSVPVASDFVVTEIGATAFRVSWQPSTDNVGVAFYEVYANGALVKQTAETSYVLTGLTSSTTYFITIRASDASGNRSQLSTPLEVKTVLNNLTIRKTSTAPVIDGTKEATWDATLPITHVFNKAPTSAADVSGSWTSLWDDNNLYFYIDVNDNQRVVDSDNAWWEDDHIEIYIDADGSRPRGYGNMQFQYAIRRGSNAIIDPHTWWGRPTTNIEVANVEKEGGVGYRIEVKIPFATLGVTAEAYKLMGIEVQIGDDDDGGTEDTRMGWFSTINQVYQSPSLMAIAQLVDETSTDNIPPFAPTDLKATAVTPNGFTISWAAPYDNVAVQSYEVFLNGNLVATPTATSVALTELTANTTYSVQVRAKDRFANLSQLSSVARITTTTRAAGVKYEAELAELTTGTMTVASREGGFSGTGYVVQSISIGAAITFTVDVPKAGTYPVSLYYSGSSRLVPYINGTKMNVLIMPGTPTPNDWRPFTELFTLKAGKNTIMYRYEATDRWISANLDYILIYPSPGADSEAPSAPVNVTASDITTSGFTLNWTASTDNSGVAPTYQVYQDGVLIGTTTSTTYDVTSLLPGAYAMTVKAVDAVGSESDASDVKLVTTLLSGVVTREHWANVAGTAVSNIPVNTKPTSVSVITSLEDPTPSSAEDQYNDFGQRIRGYIVPSTSATYYFYIASDNNGEFWLSSDDQPANKGTAPVAQLRGSTGPREWTKDLRNQKSAGIALVAGRKYYFEALMKESGGNNNLSIGWTTATDDTDITVVGSSNIEAYVPFVPLVLMVVSPSTVGIDKGDTKQLKVSVFPANATNQDLTWTSSNPAVATVDNTGLVTGVGLGSAIITATTNDGSKSASSPIAVEPAAQRGVVIQEVWNWIGAGRTVADIPLTRRPSLTRELTSLEDPSPFAGGGEYDQYGQRIRGYIIPSTTATYYFYIASDENGQFWLSSDYNPANKGTAPIAHITGNNAPDFNNGATGQREWTNSVHASYQKSAGKALVAGKKYYFEALMKERYGFNHLAIGWTTSTSNSGITVIGSANIAKYEVEGCTTCRPANAEMQAIAANELGLKVYPNPASSEVTLDLSGFAGESAVQVKMSDMTGKLFVGQQVQLGAGEKQVTLPVSHLPQGLFFVTVQGSKTTKTAKLVITK